MRKKEEEKALEIKKLPKHLKSVPGMKDYLPRDYDYWHYLNRVVRKFSRTYGFRELETSMLENPALFNKGLGKKAAAVEDLFMLTSKKGNESLCLRAELTLPVIRAYFEHRMYHDPQPVKLFSRGPVFREANLKYGEPRSLHQMGVYIVGEDSPMADVQVIMFAHHILKEAGLKLNVQINSMGSLQCREGYKGALAAYYRGKKKLLCKTCQDKIGKSPLYILDCSEECCNELKTDAPQTVDWLSEKSKEHFVKVLECLDEVNISYTLNPFLVSGLDYNAKTVFEIFEVTDKDDAKPVLLGAGGRYNELAEKVSGFDVPVIGCTLIYENLIKRLRQLQIDVDLEDTPDIYVAQLGDMAKKKALSLFEKMREDDIAVVENFSQDNLNKQLEMAAKIGVRFTLVLGQKEILDGTIIIRDMDGGVQETVDFNKVIGIIKKRLAKKK